MAADGMYNNHAGRPVPALVLGSGVTALGTVRALASAGIPAWLPPAARPPASRSRHARRLPGGDAGTDLAGLLGRVPLERAVLLPCSDAWAGATARLSGDLAARFPASVAPPAVLDQLVDKARFAGALARHGTPHPATWVLGTGALPDAIPAAVFASAFLKPLDSQACFARFGVKGFWIRSRAEAESRRAELAAAGVAVLLQEYVPGGPDRHWFVDGLVDGAGRIPGLLVRRRLRMYPPDFGNSSAMVSVPPAEASPAVESITGLLAALGYRGPFSAEFKQDARDDVFRLLEVNARMWWYVEFAARCGVNVPRLAWQDALGGPVAPVAGYATGRRCVYPYYDWHATRTWRGGSPTRMVRWAAAALAADQPVFRWGDPLPALAEMGETASRWIRRRLARGRG